MARSGVAPAAVHWKKLPDDNSSVPQPLPGEGSSRLGQHPRQDARQAHGQEHNRQLPEGELWPPEDC